MRVASLPLPFPSFFPLLRGLKERERKRTSPLVARLSPFPFLPLFFSPPSPAFIAWRRREDEEYNCRASNLYMLIILCLFVFLSLFLPLFFSLWAGRAHRAGQE